MTDLREPGSRAILIGASRYDSDKLADVTAVVDTVNDLRTALIDRCGMRRENIIDLRDAADATKVMAAVAKEAQRTRGILLVYYVGHGLTHRGDLYLSVGGTDPAPGYARERTAIPYVNIASQLAESRALAIIVILDCCFSGRALPRDDPSGRTPGIPAGPRGGLVLTSAAREEHAIVRKNNTYTAFTGQFLKLLNEGDPDSPPKLTLRAACDYLDKALDGRLPRPLWMFTGVADNIVLTDNCASVRKTRDEHRGPRRPRVPVKRLIIAGMGVALLAAAALVPTLAVLLNHSRSNKPQVPNVRSTRSAPALTLTDPRADCASGSITLIGSGFGPIANRAASAYTSQCRHAVINVEYGNGIDSADGVTQVEKTVNSHSAQAGSTIAMYDGVTTSAKGLTPDPVGVLIYSVVAHTGAIPGSNISVAELKQLYTQPAGLPGKVGVSLQAGSANRQALLGLWNEKEPGPVIPGNCPAPSGSAVSYPRCTEDSYVAALGFVEGTPNAIGYAAIDAEVDGHPTGYPQASTIYSNTSVLRINGAAPSPKNVRNGSYAFVTVEHLYLPPRPTALAQSFIAFLPRYLASNQSPDYTTCSNAPRSLATECAAPR